MSYIPDAMRAEMDDAFKKAIDHIMLDHSEDSFLDVCEEGELLFKNCIPEYSLYFNGVEAGLNVKLYGLPALELEEISGGISDFSVQMLGRIKNRILNDEDGDYDTKTLWERYGGVIEGLEDDPNPNIAVYDLYTAITGNYAKPAVWIKFRGENVSAFLSDDRSSMRSDLKLPKENMDNIVAVISNAVKEMAEQKAMIFEPKPEYNFQTVPRRYVPAEEVYQFLCDTGHAKPDKASPAKEKDVEI